MSNFQIILIDAMNLAHSSQELVVLLMGQARLSRFWLVIQQNDLMKKKSDRAPPILSIFLNRF